MNGKSNAIKSLPRFVYQLFFEILPLFHKSFVLVQTMHIDAESSASFQTVQVDQILMSFDESFSGYNFLDYWRLFVVLYRTTKTIGMFLLFWNFFWLHFNFTCVVEVKFPSVIRRIWIFVYPVDVQIWFIGRRWRIAVIRRSDSGGSVASILISSGSSFSSVPVSTSKTTSIAHSTGKRNVTIWKT